jgi:hypothetical protein
MLILFPKFSTVAQLPEHFGRALKIVERAELDQVSNIHISFLAWRGDQICDVVNANGHRSQFAFEPVYDSACPNRRELRNAVEFQYATPLRSWSEHPKWAR